MCGTLESGGRLRLRIVQAWQVVRWAFHSFAQKTRPVQEARMRLLPYMGIAERTRPKAGPPGCDIYGYWMVTDTVAI